VNPALVQQLLPLALAFIMFYLGLTLALADFRRVAQRPMALAVGLAGQILLVPLAAFAVATLCGLAPLMAVGLMVLAACPGGVSSGLLTHLARGETALSISLTAVTSLVSMLTLPLVLNLSLQHFMGSSLQAQLPLAPMVRSIFLLTTLLLNALVLGSAWVLASQARLSPADRVAVVTECGLQNSALGIFVCLQLLEAPAMSAPSVVYALLMNAGGMGFVLLMRRRHPGASPA
jgi:BASS family bile acid:Na+ symporter